MFERAIRGERKVSLEIVDSVFVTAGSIAAALLPRLSEVDRASCISTSSAPSSVRSMTVLSRDGVVSASAGIASVHADNAARSAM